MEVDYKNINYRKKVTDLRGNKLILRAWRQNRSESLWVSCLWSYKNGSGVDDDDDDDDDINNNHHLVKLIHIGNNRQ
jgi:hypothetical protein